MKKQPIIFSSCLAEHPPLVGTVRKERPEPFFQRHINSMKYRIGRYSGLMPTTDTLKDFTHFSKIGFRMTAFLIAKYIMPVGVYEDGEKNLLQIEILLETRKKSMYYTY